MKREDYLFIGFIVVALATWIYFAFAFHACAGYKSCEESPLPSIVPTITTPELSDTPSEMPTVTVIPSYSPSPNASNSGESTYSTSGGGSGVSDGRNDGLSDGKSDGRSDGLCSLPPCVTPGATLPQNPPQAGRGN